MLKTDYSQIANSYDKNRHRLSIPKEPLIAELLNEKSSMSILDLGCGTGNYIVAQNGYYENDARIQWTGVDASPDMLEVAKSKAPDAKFVLSTAEEYGNPESPFDLIVSNFAFHHFSDKPTALDNVAALLAEGGYFRYTNVAPEFMRSWWVYHYCVESWHEDKHRFWDAELLSYEIEKRGMEVSSEVRVGRKRRSLLEIREDFVRRDTSQLAMLDDGVYNRGVKQLERDIEQHAGPYLDEFAIVNLVARCPE